MSFVRLKSDLKCADDIEEERRASSFRVEELTNLLDDSPEATRERREIENLFLQNEKFRVDYDPYSLDYEERYAKGLELSLALEKVVSETDIPSQIPGNLQFIRSPHISSLVNPVENPLIVHLLMFVHTILSQGTEEQHRQWLQLAKSNKIIGSYVQTELGHGTNMKGLETTATYDPQTQQFVLHSPTLTSIKFWPGGLGRTCNYAMVAAQLHSLNKNHGIHYFLVQLRNLKDHSPLPGITVGEIGPKMGLNGNDNGFLRFQHVKIPRTQMLMRHAQILPDGTYVKPAERHSGYATLIMARAGIIWESPLRLAQAVTIAVRYSVIRRQGEITQGREVKILDYQTQQCKLIPQVAVAWGMIFTFKALRNFFMSAAVSSSADQKAELHAIVAGLKALGSQSATSGVEQCRLACGGLGYLMASRLPYLYSYLSAACTYDGENTILLLQTARFLMKAVKNVKDGNPLSPSVQYLKEDFNVSGSLQGVDELTNLYKVTASRLICDVYDQLERETALGKPPEIAWNENSINLVKCAKIHCHVYVMQTLSNLLKEINVSGSLQLALSRLFELLGAYWLIENAGDFLRYGGLSHQVFDSIKDRFQTLLADLRFDAVTLVDAFDFRDEALHSIIGCYDGRVYERVYEYVQQLPSNKKKINAAFKYLRPSLQSRL